MGRVHHSFTPFTPPLTLGGGGGWHGSSPQSVSVRSLFPPSLSGLVSHLWLLAPALERSSVKAWPGSGPFMSRRISCQMNRCAPPDRALCLARRDARGQTLRLRELTRKRREHKEDREVGSAGLTDLLLMWPTLMRARQRKCNPPKKTTLDSQSANLTDALSAFRAFRI